MEHQRIRKFNTKDTYPEQKLDNDLCQVVVAKGTMVFVRGQIGQDLKTSKSVGVGDVAAQTEQAMKNIKMLLTEAGSSLQHIARSRSTSSTRVTGKLSIAWSVDTSKVSFRSRRGSSSRRWPGQNGW